LDDAEVDVQSLEIRNITSDSVSIRLNMKINSDNQAHVNLDTTEYSLTISDSLVSEDMPPALRGKSPSGPVYFKEHKRRTIQARESSDNLDAMFEPGFLGNFLVNSTSLNKGKGAMAVATKVKLGVDGDLRLQDPRAWSGFVLALLYRQNLGMTMSGRVRASFMGVWKKIYVSKPLEILGRSSSHCFNLLFLIGFFLTNSVQGSMGSGEFTLRITKASMALTETSLGISFGITPANCRWSL
jgi:hypothetical protein